jgi:hypothetical protein
MAILEINEFSRKPIQDHLKIPLEVYGCLDANLSCNFLITHLCTNMVNFVGYQRRPRLLAP